VERAAASLLGIRAYGVHINGYTTAPDGTQQLWVAKRSKLKPTFPGKLDHLVAGGLPAGIPPMECVIKECGEEASIPPELARMSRPVGIITYNANYQGCCKRDVLFCYDLELPVDFEPVPDDGEVECFERYDCRSIDELYFEHGGVQDELRGGDHRLAGAARVPVAGGARVRTAGQVHSAVVLAGEDK
jgi:8-oxo-dGTP pyrophosphatase MutT (NUDIX family)